MSSTGSAVAPRTAGEVTLPLSLALIAGVVDVTTFVLLAGFFSAHITGNLVSLAAELALHRPIRVASVLSIPLFVAVSAVLTVLVDRSPAAPWVWVRRLLALQLLLVVAAGTLAIVTEPTSATAAGAVTGLLAVGAMATQNSLLHLTFRRSPTTAVMTGNLVAATVALTTLLLRGRQDAADSQVWRSTWPLIAGFFGGCLLGALACRWFGSWAWVLPMALCAAVTVRSLVVGPPPEIGRHA